MNKTFRENNNLDDDTYDEGVDVLGAVPMMHSAITRTASSNVLPMSTRSGAPAPTSGSTPSFSPTSSTTNTRSTPGSGLNAAALSSMFTPQAQAQQVVQPARALTQPVMQPQLSRMPVAVAPAVRTPATFVPANALMNAGSSLLSAIKSAVTPNKPGTAATSASMSAAKIAGQRAVAVGKKLAKWGKGKKLVAAGNAFIKKASMPVAAAAATKVTGFDVILDALTNGSGKIFFDTSSIQALNDLGDTEVNILSLIDQLNAAGVSTDGSTDGSTASTDGTTSFYGDALASHIDSSSTTPSALISAGQAIANECENLMNEFNPLAATGNDGWAVAPAQPIQAKAAAWITQATNALAAVGITATTPTATASTSATPPAGTLTPGAQWTPNTQYAAGASVSNQGNLYMAITAGQSGATGPTGTGTNIADGTVYWNYAGVSTNTASNTAGNAPMQWTPGTVYALGAQVTNGGNLYQCIAAGTSGPATLSYGAQVPGPFGMLASIQDGTARWAYMGIDPAYAAQQQYADQGGGDYGGGGGSGSGGSDDGGDGSSDPSDPFSDNYDPSAAGGSADGGGDLQPGYDPSMYGQDPFATDDGSSDGSDDGGWSGDGGSMDDALTSLQDNGGTSDDDASFDADVAAYQANQTSDDVFGLPSVDSFWSTDPAANTSLYYTMNPNGGPSQGTASAGATANLSASQQNLANIQAQQAQFYQSRNPYANAGQPVQAGAPTGFAAALAASKQQTFQSGGQDDVAGLDGGLDAGETTAAMLALGPFAALLFDRGNHLPMLAWAKAYKPGAASYIKPGSSAHRAAVAAEAARAAILAAHQQSGGLPMSNSDDSVFGNLPLSIQIEQARAAAAAAVKQGAYVPQSAYANQGQYGQSPYGQQSPYGSPYGQQSPYGQYGMQDPNAPDPYDAYFADDDSFQGEGAPMRSMDRQRARAKQYLNSEPIHVFGETEITDEEDDTTRRGASTHAGASYLDPGYPRGGASAGRSGGLVDFNKETIHVFGDDITIGDDGYEHGMDILGLLGGSKPAAPPRAGFVMRKTPGGNSHVSLKVNTPKKGNHAASIKNARDAANRALSIAKKLQSLSKTTIHGLIATARSGKAVHPRHLMTAAQIQKVAKQVTDTANKTLAQAKKHETLISHNRAKTKAGIATVKSALKKVAAPGTKTKVNGYVDILGLTGFGTPTAESNSLNSQITAASQASATTAYPAVDPSTGYSVDPSTGYSIDPTTGLPIDPTTGLPMDPSATGASVDSTGGGTVADPTAGPPYYGLTPPDPNAIAPQLNVDYIADPAPSGADNTQYTSVPMGAILYDGTTHDPREAVGSFKAFSEYGGNGTGFFAGNNGWSRRGSPDDDWGGLQAQYSQAANPMLKIAQDSISQGFGPIVGNGRNQSNTAWAKNLRYDMTSGNLFWYYDQAPADQKTQMLNELQQQAMTDFQAQVAAAAADAASQAAQDQLDAQQAAAIAKQQAAEDADQAHQLNLSNAQAAADAQTQGLADTAAAQEQQTQDESNIRMQQQLDQSTAAQQAANDASQVQALQTQAEIDRQAAQQQADLDIQYAQAGLLPPDMSQQQGQGQDDGSQYADDGSGGGGSDPFADGSDMSDAGYSGGASGRYSPDLDLDAQSQDSLEGISGSARLKRRKHR